MKECIVAGVQITIEPNKPLENTRKVIAWIDKAVEFCSPDLIVFPETITTGFVTKLSREELWDLVDTVPGRYTDMVAEAAKKHGVYVLFPTYERGKVRGEVYNAAPLIAPDGSVAGCYRKTHLFPPERGWCDPGTEVKVVETPFAKIGTIVCFDGDYPELSRSLAMQGAEIILRPSALLRSFDIWDLTTRARAYDNHVYMLAVNAVGTDANGTCYFGNSMIVSPVAQHLALGTAAEGIIWAKLDPDPVRYISYGCSTPMIFHHMEDRNVDVYQDILKMSEAQFPKFGS
ncbi:MAG: carbon-nitrogen hydrolase family protein [Oscillospiraceae bacterium]|nr:carbon-nitrogen hydrolase family protein [Oscillospiraceae bacterium]